jgi:siroheme synthase-like protein
MSNFLFRIFLCKLIKMEDEAKHKRFFPLFFRLDGMKILIIGGGKVAERKIKTLLRFGASITLIAPEVTEEILELADRGEFCWIPKRYNYGDLKGFRLVIATTDDEQVNSQIQMEAEREKLLLNIADKTDACNVIFPAIIERGDLTVAIASDGSAPFFARAVKEDLERQLPSGLAEKTASAQKFRQFVLEHCPKEETKLKMYERFLENPKSQEPEWEKWSWDFGHQT